MITREEDTESKAIETIATVEVLEALIKVSTLLISLFLQSRQI
jgi:hypothetical protein